MTRPVRDVAIVGRDAALWMSALALRRALSGLNIRIHAVELPSLLRPADVYASTPHLSGLHHMLGLEDDDVLAATSGSEALAQRFAGWSKGDQTFMHAYDSIGASLNQVGFIDYWTRARSEGLRTAIEDFSLGAAAAKVGRHVVLGEAVESFSRAAPGFNLDARRYVALLRGAALTAGVSLRSESFRGIDVADGGIAAIVLDDDRRLSADLYVDASGPEALLRRRLAPDDFTSWRDWLPCDRMLVASGPRLRPLPAFNQVSAFASGWVAQYPLQDRTAVVGVYPSDRVSDAAALTAFSRITGMALNGAVASRQEPGRWMDGWVRNCVALGDAAVSLEALDATQLQVIHVGLSHLIGQFPIDADNQVESTAYNHEVGAYFDNMRDFTVAHYKLNRRFDEAFWDGVRDVEAPVGLKEKLAVFGSRGGMVMGDGETFDEGSWTASFVGHGLIPRSWNPLVDQASIADQIQHFQNILGFIAAEVEDMPSLEAHLEFNAAPRGNGLF